MSTTHDSPPPIPPKPNTPDRSSQVSNVTNIDQLLNLIDNEIGNSRSDDETWNQASIRQPAHVDPKHQAMPLNISTNTHFSEAANTANPIGPHQMLSQHATTAYNPNSNSSNAQHVYPPQPNYNSAQPYYNNNYSGRQYQYQGAYTGPYYSSYPRDLTSQGWPAQTSAYPPNSNTRPLPNPPSNTTIYPSHNQSAQYSHMYPYGVPYVPPTNVPSAMPVYPVMPDYLKYIDNSTGSHVQHVDQNIQPPRSPQPHSQPVYSQELPYDAYPTDYTHNYSSSSGPSTNTWPLTTPQTTSIKQTSSIPEAKRPHSAAPRPMNPALLSCIALVFRTNIKLGTHTKGALEYPESFTGKDAVVLLH